MDVLQSIVLAHGHHVLRSIFKKVVFCIEKLHFQLTFTFVMETAPIIHSDSFASIGTDGLFDCGTGSLHFCDLAINALSCGAVVNFPDFSILNGDEDIAHCIGKHG